MYLDNFVASPARRRWDGTRVNAMKTKRSFDVFRSFSFSVRSPKDKSRLRRLLLIVFVFVALGDSWQIRDKVEEVIKFVFGEGSYCPKRNF